MVRVDTAKKVECQSIARLHVEGITTGFLSKLGHDFLTRLYSAMRDSQYGVLLVSTDGDGHVDGFVSGSTSTERFYLDFLMSSYGLQSIAALFSSLLGRKKLNRSDKSYTKKSLVIKCIESLYYPCRRRDDFLPKAELLSIVVKEKKWSSGIAGGLLVRLKARFFLQGIREFKVVVASENKRACRFYEKNGGKLVKRIEVHKNEISNVYVFDT